MLPWIEPMLYTDMQRKRMEYSCLACGRECYSPEGLCLHCERRQT